MNKWVTALVGLVGGVAVGTGVVEASVVTGTLSSLSPEAATYASLIGGVIGSVVGFRVKNRVPPALLEQGDQTQ